MVAYFDLKNLESFFAQPKDDLFETSFRMLTRQFDLCFNFSKEDVRNSSGFQQLAKRLADGAGNKKVEFKPEKFPFRNVKSNSHKEFTNEQLLSVYFINDETLHKLKNKDELLIADIGEEMTIFKQLCFSSGDYKFYKQLRIGEEFKSWKDLSDFHSPFIDLIIVDNFILSDISMLETNLLGIIKNSLKEDVRKKINIIIFLKGGEDKVEFSDLKTQIKKVVENKCTDTPNITIIKHYVEHDRTILKNFVRVKSGDTFNYFLSNGQKTTKGKEIDFFSIADRENYNLYLHTLNDLQKIVDGSKSENIIGDKVSRFLNF